MLNLRILSVIAASLTLSGCSTMDMAAWANAMNYSNQQYNNDMQRAYSQQQVNYYKTEYENEPAIRPNYNWPTLPEPSKKIYCYYSAYGTEVCSER